MTLSLPLLREAMFFLRVKALLQYFARSMHWCLFAPPTITRRLHRPLLPQAPMFIFRITKFAAIYSMGSIMSMCRWGAGGEQVGTVTSLLEGMCWLAQPPRLLLLSLPPPTSPLNCSATVTPVCVPACLRPGCLPWHHASHQPQPGPGAAVN